MKTFYILMILSMVFFSCNEKVIIEPKYTNDTDWTPEITLTGNNYHRFELRWDFPPRIELERNILQYNIELKKHGEQNYSKYDTIEIYRHFLPARYTSPGDLEENVEFSSRLNLQYRGGIERISNTISFKTPVVKGKVLRRISLPTDPIYADFPPRCIGFGNGYLYALRDRVLTRTDTTTGNTLVIKDLLIPSDGRFPPSSFDDFPVHGDTVYLTEQPLSDTTRIRLSLLNLASVEIENILEIPIPDEALGGRAIAYNGEGIYILWVFREEEFQFVELDPKTGNIVQSFPRFQQNFSFLDNDFAFDGSRIWIARRMDFDNRISQFDLSDSIISLEHRNPIFYSIRLVWDGTHFWVFDRNNHSFTKIQLDGI